eukprot:CAMPEP_0169449996 /NCGR_PEP_ID=MMETSP1042-20121227/12918_1 /TAXON_ID=464988 /ORGANISM="Hemiselmis andersenii, Strain CCMP1180" /LENGTH=646 /DNA_ID=CAMNT_0009561791 /DNA_START=558 /DNA_END=2498 /DNA_ORIENTATION=-
MRMRGSGAGEEGAAANRRLEGAENELQEAREELNHAKEKLKTEEAELQQAKAEVPLDEERVAKTELGVAEAKLGVAGAKLCVAEARWHAAPKEERVVVMFSLEAAQENVKTARKVYNMLLDGIRPQVVTKRSSEISDVSTSPSIDEKLERMSSSLEAMSSKQEAISLSVEEMSSKQEAMSSKQEAISSSVEEMSSKQDYMRRQLLVSRGKVLQTKTRAELGADAFQTLEITSFNGDDSADPFADESLAVLCREAGTERELGGHLLPHFRQISADSDLVVLDCQDHGWLDSLKPDYAVLPHPFWHCSTTKSSKPAKQVGRVADPLWYSSIRSLVELKKNISNDARGQVVEYAMRLGESIHVLLVDQQMYFEAYKFDYGEPQQVVQGSLTDRGSAAFVQQFLVRPDFPVSPRERDLRAALCELSCDIVEGEGFLGAGGSALVFHIRRDGCSQAMKVFSATDAPKGTVEVKKLQKLQDAGVADVPTVLDCRALSTGAYVFLMSTVGEPIHGRKKTVWTLSQVKGLFEAMSALHVAGWCHGDARYHNFVAVNESHVPIDFVYASEKATPQCIREDMLRLAASVLELEDCNDLTIEPADIVADSFSGKLLGELEERVQAYCVNGYSKEHAAELGRVVYDVLCQPLATKAKW